MANPKNPEWESMKLDGLRNRLLEVKQLLQQAAAVGLSQDVGRLERLAELQDEEDGGHHKRRRYR